MVHILYSKHAKPRDVNLPDSLPHRSGGKTVLLIPGQSLEITDDEWKLIQGKHADLLSDIKVLGS